MDLTFDQFKTLLLPLFVNSHYFDDDKIREAYRDYDELRHLPAFDTVKKFAEWYFKDWKKGTHNAWLKSHKELKQENRPSKKPKQIQKIKKFSTKRTATEREYEKVKSEIMNERPHSCAGCGRSDLMISFSHRISRSERPDLIAEKSNIDLMCFECADKVESFKWNELLNGNEIAEYIKKTQPERYWIYFYKNKAI